MFELNEHLDNSSMSQKDTGRTSADKRVVYKLVGRCVWINQNHYVSQVSIDGKIYYYDDMLPQSTAKVPPAASLGTKPAARATSIQDDKFGSPTYYVYVRVSKHNTVSFNFQRYNLPNWQYMQFELLTSEFRQLGRMTRFVTMKI